MELVSELNGDVAVQQGLAMELGSGALSLTWCQDVNESVAYRTITRADRYVDVFAKVGYPYQSFAFIQVGVNPETCREIGMY